jgi:hypothetical protein
LDKNIQGIDPERDSSITRDADGRIALVMTSAFLIKENNNNFTRWPFTVEKDPT